MNTSPKNALVSLELASEFIRSGAALSIAGPEQLLAKLPAGNWVGGTSSYFVAANGGVKAADKVFVTRLSEEIGTARLVYYHASALKDIVHDAPENGFSFTIIASGSIALRRFSREGRFWPDIFLKPLIGWIAGVDLSLPGKPTPKIYNGSDGSSYEDGAVVAHVSLPPGRRASIETVNIFERDLCGVIRFPKTTSEVVECTVNGVPTKLVDYLASHGNADGKLPMIGDFAGAGINVSVKAIYPATGQVSLFAPVFPDVEYYLALPVENYAARFAEELVKWEGKDVVFSCNCILNYLYGGFEGKLTGTPQGPVTFGEIAYLLLNQTMVVLTIT